MFVSLGLGRWLLAGFIFAVLLAVLLYQLFAPGSELRYYRCRQGSIKGSEMWFTFTTHDVQVSCFLSISLHTPAKSFSNDLLDGAEVISSINKCSARHTPRAFSITEHFHAVLVLLTICLCHVILTIIISIGSWQNISSSKVESKLAVCHKCSFAVFFSYG